jgi:polyferredoxin
MLLSLRFALWGLVIAGVLVAIVASHLSMRHLMPGVSYWDIATKRKSALWTGECFKPEATPLLRLFRIGLVVALASGVGMIATG